MFSKQKFLLLFLVILRYPIDKDSQEIGKLDYQLLRDFKFCKNCFQNHSEFCEQVRFDYEFVEDLTNNLNILFGVRQSRVLREINNKSHRIFVKYLARDFNFSSIGQIENEKQAIDNLSKRFLNEYRLDGMQFCPQDEINRFVDFFGRNYSLLNIWMHMNVDIQPILLPYLHSMGFPVPKTYATCGFTIFQSADGDPLANLYSSDFPVKLKIATQLIEGALKFTEGFEGFRIYITDLNMDNVVYNLVEEKLSFVDLDTVLIVYGRNNADSVHNHEYWECDGCFAFSPNDICVHGRSDINLFSVCQLLREDLKNDRSKGFLFPIPELYSELEELLNECVHCPRKTCESRFKVAAKIIERFKEILQNIYM